MVAKVAEQRHENFSSWYLEEYGGDGQIARRHRLSALPFSVGRSHDAGATVDFPAVSGRHAELFAHEGALWLRDLESSNGTYRNGVRIREPTVLAEGDVIRLAHVELLVGQETDEQSIGCETQKFRPADLVSVTSHAANASALRELVSGRRAAAVFQPIVDFSDPDRTAFELLGRGAHEALPDSPALLFEIAARIGLEIELSSLFGEVGLEESTTLPGEPRVFINTHPAELDQETLTPSLRSTREQHRTRRLVVEIHEACITDTKTMRTLRAVLDDLGMDLAYDDFGAGQARILELVDVPPDYLKFDISLVREIDQAPATRQKMLESLVAMARDLGIACVAEGIETRGELDTCRQMGFEHGQGYYLGRPAPAVAWLEASLEGSLGTILRA